MNRRGFLLATVGLSGATTAASAGRASAAAGALVPGTDISAQLRAQLRTASAAGGGVVAVTAPGTYFVENVDLCSRVVLELGAGVVLKYPNGSTASKMLNLPNGTTAAGVRGAGALDGNRTAYRGDRINGGDLVYCGPAVNAADLRVEGITLREAPRSGITTYGGLSGLQVSGCRFVGMTLHAAIAYNTAAVTWTDNQIDRSADRIAPNTPSLQYWANPGNDDDGPTIERNRIVSPTDTGAENAFIGIEVHADGTGRITGGKVADNRISGGSIGISIVNCEGTLISGNDVRHSDFCGIEIAGGAGSSVLTNSYDGEGVGSGIRCNNVVRGVTIHGNSIADVSDSYSAGGIHSNCQLLTDASIIGNTVTGSYSKLSAVYLNNISGAVVADNVLQIEATGDGLYCIDIRATAADVDDNDVHDNIVVNQRGGAQMNGMISVMTRGGFQARRNSISGNTLKLAPGGRGPAVNLQGTTPGSVFATAVQANHLSGPFTATIRQKNTTETRIS